MVRPETSQTEHNKKMDFYDLDLNDRVLDALDDMNFTETTPIQEYAIPSILDGRDLIGIAQTGTGKTAAYLLPVLSLLQDGGYPKDSINCIIMSPTRELAQQIDQAMQGFSYYLDDISSVAVYGGNDGIRYEQEKRGMQQGADVVIATPGRLISHLSLGNIDLSRVSFFILDEADRMLDMGFYDDIIQIVKSLPTNRQTIMFSATMPSRIQQLAHTILNNPVEVKLAVSKPADNIRQQAYICYETQKIPLIKSLFKQTTPERVIIFVGSKVKTKDLAISLQRAGFNARAMHSDLTQGERDDAMYAFRAGQVDILVATDIVARGIDIDDIRLVINYDVPHDEEDYVHRIGRTARAGRDGNAITLVSEKDIPKFKSIERFLGTPVEKVPLEGGLGEAPNYDHPASANRKKAPKKQKARSKHSDKVSKEKAKDEPKSKRTSQKQQARKQKKENTSSTVGENQTMPETPSSSPEPTATREKKQRRKRHKPRKKPAQQEGNQAISKEDTATTSQPNTL